MLVVSNTSPISNLALIGRLDLLRDQFEQVWIPDAVRVELDHIPDPRGESFDSASLRAGLDPVPHRRERPIGRSPRQ